MKFESKYNVGDKVCYLEKSTDNFMSEVITSISFNGCFQYTLSNDDYICEEKLFNNFEDFYQHTNQEIQNKLKEAMEWLEDIKKEYNNE